MPIVATGLSHHSAPVELRERFAFSQTRLVESLDQLIKSGVAQEAVILSTCNRVEIYAYTDDPNGAAAIREFLIESGSCDDVIGDEIYTHGEPHSVEHLFKVASGLNSMVLGETEILGQIKQAYKLALEGKFTGGKLNKAFQTAFNVAKWIRTHTQIQRGNVSVASVAVSLAESIFSSLSECKVMVIGAGDTSEKTARALLSRGAHSILVSNRSHERALELARELDGAAIHFDEWESAFSEIDIVISSTSAPHYVLDRAKLEPFMHQRKNRDLLLIDIAVPRDIAPEVNFLDNVYLYNVDDLQSSADDSMAERREEISRCEEFIREKAKKALTTRRAASSSRGELACGHE